MAKIESQILYSDQDIRKKWNLGVTLSDDLLNSFNFLSHYCLLCRFSICGLFFNPIVYHFFTLFVLFIFTRFFTCGLRVGKIVDGDGKEDVEQDVVAADEEDDEVDADDLAPALQLQIFWS